MSCECESPDGSRLWTTPDGVHLDVRGLECPAPMVQTLGLIERGDVGNVIIVHLDQEPLFLYPGAGRPRLEPRSDRLVLRRSELRGRSAVAPRAHARVTLAATFLGGAKSRLLPPSLPFRFFATAAALHIALWVVLLLAGADAASFRGGLGPPLAAVHLLTLGVLTTTAIGAAAQLLPVATRRALAAVWPIKLVFWLTVPGLIVLIAGMYAYQPLVMIVGAVATSAGLLLFAGLLADNLRRAGSLQVVAAYGWAAFAALIGLVSLGLALSIDFDTGFLGDHAATALAHMLLGGFGFMGMLALGFSHVLVPMFALSSAPAKRPAYVGLRCRRRRDRARDGRRAARQPILMSAAGVIGIAATTAHVRLMHVALATGMRKRLGLSFILVRASWACLLLTPLIGLAALYDWAGPNGADAVRPRTARRLADDLPVRHSAADHAVPRLDACDAAEGRPSPALGTGGRGPADRARVCHGVALLGLAAAIILDSGCCRAARRRSA